MPEDGDEEIPPIPEDEEIKPKLKGKELFKLWVNVVMASQMMCGEKPCGNPHCIHLPRSGLPAPYCFFEIVLRRNDCIHAYRHRLWRYLWKHYDETQYKDPTDYLSFLLSKIHDNKTCAICFDDLGENNLRKCSNKKCIYFFHNSCIRQWHDKQNTCPCCRAPIKK
jgi:hypothetical protein